MADTASEPKTAEDLLSEIRDLLRQLLRQAEQPIEPLWTAAEAALYLGISERAVKDMAYRMKIPSIKQGKFVRFEKSALVRWKDSRTRKPK